MTAKAKTPYVTLGVMAVCAAMFMLVSLSGMENGTEAAILAGAYYKPFILAGEWWRIISYGFVHAELMHIFMNMFSMYIVGRMMEFRLGPVRYLILLFLSIAGGGAFIFAAQGNTVMVGMSGGLYGLLGGYFYIAAVSGGLQNRAVRNVLIRTFVINLLINLMPGIAVGAHIGGLITGIFVTALLVEDSKGLKKHFAAAGLAFVLILGWMARQSAYIPSDKVYMLSDYRVLKKEMDLGFGKHALRMAEKLADIYNDSDNTLYEELSRQ
ncbi:MAG: rhomboid family intramembrane serine protease [Solobacterium sp.]|nr:rhomboid family intramembrane serine protease [Solobacterium sp.]